MAFLLGFSLLLFAGCGRTTCSGDDCRCEDGASCAFACEGAGCDFVCQAGGSCDHTCDGGGCQIQCEDVDGCELDCAGNDCQMQCEGTNVCRLTGCTEDCQLQCGGAEVCESSCTRRGLPDAALIVDAGPCAAVTPSGPARRASLSEA
jgi:hypothetical protein